MRSRCSIFLLSLLIMILMPCCVQSACRNICDYLIGFNVTNLISTSATVSASNYCDSTAWYCLGWTPEVQHTNLVDPDMSVPGWNSGGMAPQYVMLSFDEPHDVYCISLYIDMDPNGKTTHLLYAGNATNTLKLVKKITNSPLTPNNIRITFDPPLFQIRHLKLQTTVSPSWVAWYRFFVYGH